MYEYGVIGLGPSGCFFIACLPEEKLARTIVFDSAQFGGDLARFYGNVVANLTCSQIVAAFHAIPRWQHAELTVLESYPAETCPRLSDVVRQLQILMEPLLKVTIRSSQHVESIWQVQIGWRVFEHLIAKLILCTGGESRNLPNSIVDVPKIPLHVALDQDMLRNTIQPGDSAVVFGTSHSGTLILRNLRLAGCGRMTAVYREWPPFCWARRHTPDCPCHLLGGTGCHDSEGLKQQSATIADAIVRGEWGTETPRLVQFHDSETLTPLLQSAKWAIHAVGFQRRSPIIYGLGGEVLEVKNDTQNAQIAPGLWGFGMAFPSLYQKPQGGKAADIGLPAFAEYIQKCMPSILYT